jgi:prolyl oligopeptidase
MITSKDDKLFLVTNENAPNMKIVVADASNPDVSNWQDLIPETENVLSPSTAGGFIFLMPFLKSINTL